MLHPFSQIGAQEENAPIVYGNDLTADEKDLEQRLRTGDQQAMSDVYVLLQPRMTRRAFQYVRDYRGILPAYLDASDLVQEASLVIYKRLEEAKAKQSPLVYLIATGYHTMQHFCLSFVQKSHGNTPLSLDRPRFDDDSTPLHEYLPTSLLPTSPYTQENEERYKPLYDAIEHLSESQKQAILRSYGLQEYAPAKLYEIQRELEWSWDRATHQKSKALATLALYLKDAYPQYVGAVPPTGYQILDAQRKRLDQAYTDLLSQSRSISVRALTREARTSRKIAYTYLWEKEGSPRLPSALVAQQRLDQAYALLLSQGRTITESSLSQEAGVQLNTARSYLKRKRDATIACAWCLVEQGQSLGTGSHGICSLHAEQVRQRSRAQREKRQAGRSSISQPERMVP